ncbi:alkyl/aryl-sulfatase [Alkalimarinus coralli]|uniref:alkyl/aryl-sulfatase n=1 Tax=Alkalimarinus coralli TaxID=2935863 RepID=UPI00202B9D91|nr:alkyl sulfatase dimerization domain-containing protein [Alkalimarinus coralli]
MTKREEGSNIQGHTTPTSVTTRANHAVLSQRPFSNRSDFEDASRGLIAQDNDLRTKDSEGNIVWDMSAYNFIDYKGADGGAPDSVNPSLWRQASLNNIHGLFQVSEGIYQLRGYDLANMTIIEGDTGWIIVDPLTAKETADKALKFAQKHLGIKPVKAIIYTHSHIDHFGGIEGIVHNLSETEQKQLRIVAPAGFMEEATSENIVAGIAMGRRASYMYGRELARNTRGHIGTGLGKGPAFGRFALLAPTETVFETGTKLNIDGVPFEFQYVPGSEAPAEMTFYLPEHKAFCGAELLSRNMHNLYTLRGAKVRYANLWSDYIIQSREMFAESEVYFASHHWPMWGKDNIRDFLTQQSDTYKYIHDQSVRLFNQGYTPNEVAEAIRLPASLNTAFHNQGYYGTVKHNAKAVYQAYLGWYTGNPAQLDPLPEAQAATRYMDMMGGVDTVVTKAQAAFDEAGGASVEEGTKTYRWIAELLNHAVFADPDNVAAKQLLANVYDQLGYQAESAPWRDVYLSAANELRHGAPEKGIDVAVMEGVLTKTPVVNFFDSMAVSLNGPKAEGKQLSVKIAFTDLNESHLLWINNAVLRHKKVAADTPADATLKLTQPLLVDIIIGKAGLKSLLFDDDLSLEGSRLDLIEFFGLLDRPDGAFNIVTP